MALLSLSRTQIYELIRSRRLVTVTQGRRRLVPAASIAELWRYCCASPSGIMATRRSWGEGSLSWSESRQRWIGRVSLGYFANGKPRIGTVSAKTKTEARSKLRALIRDQEDGLAIAQRGYTVSDAVESWLKHGMTGRDPNTLANRATLARTHLIPALGRRRLDDLSAEEVDAWLASKVGSLSTETLARLLGIL